MDNYLVSYTDEALQDLRDIHDYIAVELKAPGIAAAQIDRIRNEIRSLDRFPRRYKSVEWELWASHEMRQMPVDNFIVFYVVSNEANAVRIVRIFYGKRDIPNIVASGQ